MKEIFLASSFTRNDLPKGLAGVTCDSRQVTPGDIFVALAGTKTDGSRYIEEAFKKGCAAVLITTDAPVPPDLSGGLLAKIPLLRSDNPRRALARLACLFYPRAPSTMVAVTGTNGKSSVVSFLRQFWELSGFQAASLGTLGLETSLNIPKLEKIASGLTSPDPVALHKTVDELDRQDVRFLALEASSHGLDQYRLDGLSLSAAAFTNLSHDHLDYHGTQAAYQAAKFRLFKELLSEGSTVVVNGNSPQATQLHEIAVARNLIYLDCGLSAGRINARRIVPYETGSAIELLIDGEKYEATLPLIGNFQIENVLIAAGLAIATGVPASTISNWLSFLRPVKGRLELIGSTAKGGQVYVDYAHTPDALARVLGDIKSHRKGELSVVFGCGGERDTDKRSRMGAIASELSDQIVITDDNPRHEDPVTIRKEILASASGAKEIADRASAIEQAISDLPAGGTLIVAGKGHEQGQIRGSEILPFDDAAHIRDCLKPAGPGS